MYEDHFPLLHVELDSAVLDSSYGDFLSTNATVILRAMGLSLNKGLPITIKLADNQDILFIGTHINGSKELLHRLYCEPKAHSRSSKCVHSLSNVYLLECFMLTHQQRGQLFMNTSSRTYKERGSEHLWSSCVLLTSRCLSTHCYRPIRSRDLNTVGALASSLLLIPAVRTRRAVESISCREQLPVAYFN